MKRLTDFDEYSQGLPKQKKLGSFETSRVRVSGYVTQEEFKKMQIELANKLEEQKTIAEQALLELKQIKLHLASMSGEDIDNSSIEED